MHLLAYTLQYPYRPHAQHPQHPHHPNLDLSSDRRTSRNLRTLANLQGIRNLLIIHITPVNRACRVIPRRRRAVVFQVVGECFG